MRRQVSYIAFMALMLAMTAIAGHGQDTKPQAAPVVEDVYLAKDNLGKAGDEVKEFVTTDLPIWCVVLLDSPARATVKMNFVAVKVAGVRPETKVVSTSYTTAANQNRVNFNGQPDGPWPAGRYRVDIFLDGKVARQVEFDIKGVGVNAASGVGIRTPAPARSKPKP